MSKEKIAAAKKYILAQPKLKLKGLAKSPEKNPKEFLKVFFSNYNKKLETVYCSNGQSQCLPGKRRSISDIYLITSYYFPKASLTKMYVELIKLIKSNSIVSGLCKVIHKRVYRGTNSGESGYLNGTMIDEFGIDLKTFKEEKVALTSGIQHTDVWGNYTREVIDFIDLD